MKQKQTPIKKEQSLYHVVKNTAEKYPHHVALRYFHHAFSYKHLLKRINQFAYSLKKLGVTKDEPVTICLPNIPDAVYALYAVNQIGAIANIVHPKFSFEQMEENLHLIKSKVLLCLDTSYEDFKPLEKEGIIIISCSPMNGLSLIEKLAYIKQNKGKLIPVQLNSKQFYKSPLENKFDDDYQKDAIYLHSGGTTNKPKIIALSSFALNAINHDASWIIGQDNFEGVGILAVLPMFHGFGLCMGIHACLGYGGVDVLMPKFSRYHAVKYIARNQLHILLGVPVLYEALLSKRNFRGKKLRHLNIAFVGGDYVSPALLERFNFRMEKAKSICRLREGYGLTEVVNVCSVNTHQYHKAGTVGKLLPNVKAVILDEKGNELPLNTDGEICIGGESLMNGYRFQEEDKSVYHFDKYGIRYIKTGDFGCLDEDRFLHYKSRIKRIVKVSGVPVFPSMIEDAATSFNFVYEVCALGVEDEKHGHIIRLYVMLSKTYKGTKEEAEEKINERIVSRLGIYSKPKEIIFMDKMPHTVVGKIDYKQLK